MTGNLEGRHNRKLAVQHGKDNADDCYASLTASKGQGEPIANVQRRDDAMRPAPPSLEPVRCKSVNALEQRQFSFSLSQLQLQLPAYIVM